MSTCRLRPTPWGIRPKLAVRHPSGSQGALGGCLTKGLGPQGSCDEEAGVTEEPHCPAPPPQVGLNTGRLGGPADHCCPAQLPWVRSHTGRPPPQVADSWQGRQDGAVPPHHPGWQIAGPDVLGSNPSRSRGPQRCGRSRRRRKDSEAAFS
uniref:Uncharacterized protein n=1 Tax=Myotis myotis TaxID=51298 RepID=A0A7J7Y047_MYOMY|nr:hypothetical protein mMyoMyo1_011519 [Myotis myotis]